MTLEQLIDEERELNRKLRDNRILQKAIRETNFMSKNGIYIGDLVLIKEQKAVISGIKHIFSNSPDFKYRAILKDGSLGKQDRTLYGYGMKHTIVIQKGFMKQEDLK